MPTRIFNLYDLLVDIIPGIIAILLIISLLPLDYNTERLLFASGLINVAVILIISYVIGHLIQAISSIIDSRLNRLIYNFINFLTSDNYHVKYLYTFEDELNKKSKENSVKNYFIDRIDSFFGDDINDKELFSVVQSYLWNNDIGRSRRFQSLYTFFRSLWILFLFGTVSYISVFFLSILDDYNSIWSISEIIIIILILMICCILSYYRRVKFQNIMVKSMIVDFYTNVLSQNN